MHLLPKARIESLVIQELGTETLIYDLKISKLFCLNQTSALVYELADGTRTIEEISSLISQRSKTSVGEDIVKLALEQLKTEDLLENSKTLKINFNGLSRRELIHKAGLTSFVILPVITSITAPKATMAQSFPTVACTTPLEGNQGTCPTDQRCVNSFCSPCIPNGSPVPGIGCVPVTNAAGIRQCCTQICSSATDLCVS